MSVKEGSLFGVGKRSIGIGVGVDEGSESKLGFESESEARSERLSGKSFSRLRISNKLSKPTVSVFIRLLM